MIPFNTLSYSKRLIEAGCEQHVAEELALAQADILFEQATKIDDLIQNKLVTKEDLACFELKVKRDLKHLESTLLLKLGLIIGSATTILGVLLKV